MSPPRPNRRGRLVTALATLLMAAGLFVVTPAPSANAMEYPGGRRIYSVAIGNIPAEGTTGSNVWVRIALYYFFGDGTVREGFWFWSRSQAIGATSSTFTSSGCDGCTVRTPTGFEPSNGGKSLYGTYVTSGDTLTITWNDTGRSSETWRISQPATDLARIDLTGSNYGARVGYGFGSSASSDAWVSMGNIPRKTYYGRAAGFSGGPASEGPSQLGLGSFTQCNTNCLSLLSAPTTACSACSSGSSSPIRYYLAGAGKRNYYEHWCRCLTSATCYTGGSHRKPMLQVIGDTGTFHGWVGVEASNFTADTGYFAVNYHVDV